MAFTVDTLRATTEPDDPLRPGATIAHQSYDLKSLRSGMSGMKEKMALGVVATL
jgi:hypothetical protein